MECTVLARWSIQEVGIIKKYYNHILQTNPRHREDVPENIYKMKNVIKQRVFVQLHVNEAYIYRCVVFLSCALN